MNQPKGIYFEEVQANPADLIHDLADPEIGKMVPIPFTAAIALRRQQVARLEDNIVLLRRKQEEFNRRMEEYVQNIRALIGSIERSIAADERSPAPEGRPAGASCTQVRCLGCGEEKVFDHLRVIAARESSESITQPTVLIVEDDGKIKKGTFACPKCGNENLLIRKLGA
jgi:hypothetical protein